MVALGRASIASTLFFAGLLALVGCTSAPPEAATGKIAAEATPREILDATIAAHRAAKSYRDKARVRLSYRVDNQPLEELTELECDFVRPNQVRFSFQRPRFQLIVASDGKTLRVRPQHPDTKDFDGQFVARPAPEELTLAEIYMGTEVADPSQPRLMTNLFEGTRVSFDDLPLALLLAEKPLATLLQGSVQLKRLPNQEIDGKLCARVLAATDAGDETLWIDCETLALRRIEMPTRKLAEQLVSQPDLQGELTNLGLTIDILQPEFDPAIEPARFALDTGDAPPQKYFVLPPRDLPSPLFGKTLGDFAFVDLAQKPVTKQSLAGDYVVLMWFHDHPTCQKAMVQLDSVYQLYKNRDRVKFYGVCTEPAAFNSGHIGAITNGWKVKVPIIRDLKTPETRLFRIEQVPTLIVLDPIGGVQIYDVGTIPRLSHDLPVALERLLAGDNLAAELLEGQKREHIEYQRMLATARGKSLPDAPAATLPIAQSPKILPRSEPLKLKLAERWKCTEVAAPGNLLVVDDPTGPTILAIDGGRSVARLDAQGKVVARVELPIPPEAKVGYLRTATDGDGKRYYAAGSRLGPQCFFFDADWKLLTAYPDSMQQHDGIQDVQLVDLDGDGKIEAYVGFWGVVGVHCVGFDGRRRWGNRVATSVLSLSPFPNVATGKRQILVTNDRGLLVPIDATGQDERAYQVGQRSIHQVTPAAFPAPRANAYLGISYQPDGGMQAIALNEKLEEAWSYDLPPGQYTNPIEAIASGKLLAAGGGQWFIAGPDHSIHIVSDDGSLADFFHYGQVLTGLAAMRVGNEAVIVAATTKGIEAWTVIQ